MRFETDDDWGECEDCWENRGQLEICRSMTESYTISRRGADGDLVELVWEDLSTDTLALEWLCYACYLKREGAGALVRLGIHGWLDEPAHEEQPKCWWTAEQVADWEAQREERRYRQELRELEWHLSQMPGTGIFPDPAEAVQTGPRGLP